MKLRLFDTYTRKIRDFEPLNPECVGLYSCGPTVYDYAHIGNLRTYLFEDILYRSLRFNGYNVKYVMNVTDVGHLVSDADTGEDKIEVGSRRTGMTAWDVAEFYTDAFKQDLVLLNIEMPDIWCKATEHIPEQIEFIEEIEAKGYTYKTSDGIYFNSRKLNDYGHLARLDIDGLRAGARVEQGERRFVTDFALWKFSAEDQSRQMEWDSPWGKGFPGWHIECSAMSAEYLGDFFDIHCGGEDHIPIHHTNEIAQSQVCKGTTLANFWMHGYFLNLNNEKMAKSSGDFLRMQTLIDRGYDPIVYRYYCLTAHYRSQLSFSWESLDASATALERLYRSAYDWGEPGCISTEFRQRFLALVNHDLNMPQALALVAELSRAEISDADKKATLLHFDEIFGLKIEAWQPADVEIPDQVHRWLLQRSQARQNKEWELADQIRGEIEAAGFIVEDGRDGARLRRK